MTALFWSTPQPEARAKQAGPALDMALLRGQLQ
jgi:hypothetical protein